MEDKKYVRLSNLVGATIRIQKVWGYKWKMWDNESRRMLISDDWQKGYRKVWQLDTDKGSLDVSHSQLASMLESVCVKGQSDVNNIKFEIKSNGKTGEQIRYFFNVVRERAPEPQQDYAPEDISDEPVDLSNVPF